MHILIAAEHIPVKNLNKKTCSIGKPKEKRQTLKEAAELKIMQPQEAVQTL